MKETGVTKTILKHKVFIMLLVCTFSFPLAAPSSFGQQGKVDSKVDYASAQQDILRFEAVINGAINSTFSSSPFAVVQQAKGVYLQGYGACFQFLVNIHRAVINTPFGKVRRSSANMAPEIKKKRIEDLKDKLIIVLQNSSGIFAGLPEENCITIVAHIEDRNIPDEPNANKTIVLSVLKKDLDELGNTSDRLEEFKKRIKIIEY